MAYVAADWSIDRQTGNIRYIGGDHNFVGGTPSYATVIEAHREWANLADDSSSQGSNDELDITDNTPSDRSTDNIITLNPPYNIDDAASEHLYDGSIIQNSGDDFYDGIVNFGNASVQIQIMQNGAIIADDWWNKKNTNTPSVHETGANSAFLDDSSAGFTASALVGYSIYNVTDGSQALISANTTTTATGDLYGGTDNDWDVNDVYLLGIGLNASAAAGISHRFMIKTRSNGADIDGRRLIGIARRFGNTYSEFKINGSSRGNNVLALSDATDLNNATNPQDVTDYDNFVNDVVGFDNSQDIDNNTVNEEYYSRWDNDGGTLPASPSINDLYEWGKWITTQGTASTMYGISGELFRGITLQIPYDGLSGVLDESSYLVWGTNVTYDTELTNGLTVGKFYEFSGGAIGQLIALDDDGTAGNAIFALQSGTPANNETFIAMDGSALNGATVDGAPLNTVESGGVGVILADNGSNKVWIQLLKGTAPVNDLPIWEATTSGVYDNDAGNFAVVNGTPTDREPLITKPFIGASTGSSIIGGYGVGISSDDLTASDILFDLGNNQITPPNNVTVTISGLVSGEDYVTVNQRGYRFAYDNEDDGTWTIGETLTLSSAGTCILAEVVDQGLTGYMIVSEPSVAAPVNNETITGGTSLTVASTNISGAAAPSDINKRQLTLAVLLDAENESAVVVSEAIPSDTPTTGVIRVQDDLGFYRRLTYTSWATSTFTISNTDGQEDFLADEAAIGNNVYIGYIDKLATATTASFQGVYSANRNLFVRVRDGGTAGDNLGIKTFETTVTMGSTGGSATAIRTSDV